MYSLFTSKVCDLIFDIGQAVSRSLVSSETVQDSESLLIMMPSNGGVCTIEVCVDPTPTDDSVWFTLVDNSANPVLTPGAGQASQLAPITFPSFRFNAGGAVAEEVRVPLFKTHR